MFRYHLLKKLQSVTGSSLDIDIAVQSHNTTQQSRLSDSQLSKHCQKSGSEHCLFDSMYKKYVLVLKQLVVWYSVLL